MQNINMKNYLSILALEDLNGVQVFLSRLILSLAFTIPICFGEIYNMI